MLFSRRDLHAHLTLHAQQIARGLVLPFTVFFSWYLLRTRSSPATLGAVAIVCVGFMLGVSSENMHTLALGISLGVASSVTTAVHAIVVKRSLSVVSGTLDLAYYSNLLSVLVIAPFVILSGEIWTVLDMLLGDGEGAAAFSTFMTGAAVTVSLSRLVRRFRTKLLIEMLSQGVFGFLICIAGFLSIKVTSPISHMISAGQSRTRPSCERFPPADPPWPDLAVRGVLQTFLGMWLFDEQVTA